MLNAMDLWMMEETVGADINGTMERARRELTEIGGGDECLFDSVCDKWQLTDAQRKMLAFDFM